MNTAPFHPVSTASGAAVVK